MSGNSSARETLRTLGADLKIPLRKAYDKAIRRFGPEVYPDLVYVLEAGKRAANETADRFGKKRDAQGILVDTKLSKYNQAVEKDPELTHHSGHHIVRVEYNAEATVHLGIPDDKKREIARNLWLPNAFFLALRMHDIGEVYCMKRNKDEKRKLNVKKGHGMEAAIMLLLSAREYREILKDGILEDIGLPPGTVKEWLIQQSSWRSVAAAAVMVMKHNQPNEYDAAIHGKKKAYSIDTNAQGLLVYQPRQIEEVYREYIDNELDLFSLSPRQMFEILALEKGEEFKSKNTPHSLHPFVESEYKDEIDSLFAQDRIDIPLERDFYFNANDGGSRENFNLLAEIFVRADLSDMLYPPIERIARTLRSAAGMLDIPFWNPDALAKPGEFLEIIKGRSGEDTDIKAIYPEYSSTVRRILWELYHIDPFTDSMISRNPSVKNMYSEIALRSAIALKRVGGHVLRLQGGFADPELEFTLAFDASYMQRIRDVTVKILKVKLQEGEINQQEYDDRVIQLDSLKSIIKGMERTETIDKYAQRMKDLVKGTEHSRRTKKTTGLIAQHNMGIDMIERERTELRTILKPQKTSKELTEEEGDLQIERFNQFMDFVIQDLGMKYGLFDSIEDFTKDDAEGKMPKSRFFKDTYDAWTATGKRGWEEENGES